MIAGWYFKRPRLIVYHALFQNLRLIIWQHLRDLGCRNAPITYVSQRPSDTPFEETVHKQHEKVFK
jgi:hypothetical protein